MTVKQYWDLLREQRCVLTRDYPVIHHCRGGSMNDILSPADRPRGAQKTNDWFVIPLSPRLHTGELGIHTLGVQTWEEQYGKQADWLAELQHITGIDIWDKSGLIKWQA